MIVYEDSFSQMAVAQTIRDPQHEYVREQLAQWMASNAYPSVCITPEADRDSIPMDKWEWRTEVKPENTFLLKVKLYVCKNDTDPVTGIAKEIAFVWYHCHCDKYYAPEGDWKLGGTFCTNGILFNHGTEDKPNWSIHT